MGAGWAGAWWGLRPQGMLCCPSQGLCSGPSGQPYPESHSPAAAGGRRAEVGTSQGGPGRPTWNWWMAMQPGEWTGQGLAECAWTIGLRCRLPTGALGSRPGDSAAPREGAGRASEHTAAPPHRAPRASGQPLSWPGLSAGYKSWPEPPPSLSRGGRGERLGGGKEGGGGLGRAGPRLLRGTFPT